MAVEHLRHSITKQNLWLYVLSTLRSGPASPGDVERDVESGFGFAPAKITFYSVLYKLRREGLVSKTAASFRSKYAITERGERALEEAIETLKNTSESLKKRRANEER